jgi:nucleotide-binding universal stress UspA family protein
MKNILVATDLSDRSDVALHRAAQLARQSGARLHVLHVVDDDVSSLVALACEESTTLALEEKLRDDPDLQHPETETHVAFGHPWLRIKDLVDHFDPDLVVLGAHRSRGLRDLFIGTTLHRVAKTCTVPVLVAVDAEITPYRTVLVGFDFSKAARRAAALAVQIAPDAAVTLVHGYHVPFKELMYEADHEGTVMTREKLRIEAEVAEQIRLFSKTLPATAGGHAIAVREGHPVKVLGTVAAQTKADLLCLGAHSRNWLAEAMLGSTASDLMSKPPCDMLVTPVAKSDTG